tara:strand:- start:3009 stop:3818 length:810 start_codon:yes stop_codon:yes gene_type:complete
LKAMLRYPSVTAARILLFGALVSFWFAFPTGEGRAQEAAPEPGTAEYWREKTIADFNKWRETIPDYEKRLYDRVKRINSRIVRLTNIIIAGFLIVFAALGWNFFSRRAKEDLPRRRTENIAMPEGRREGAAGTGILETVNRFLPTPTKEERIRKSQQLLKKALDNLLSYQTVRAENVRELSQMSERANRIFKRLEKESEVAVAAAAAGQRKALQSIRRRQNALQRAVNDLSVLGKESAAEAEGLSALTEKARNALDDLERRMSGDMRTG